MSTKFFACLDLEDSKNIAEATSMVELQPHSLLFRAGDDGSEGIFVVVEGSLGMFLHDGEKLVQTNALQPGESVGDLDVIDGMFSAYSRFLRLLLQALKAMLCCAFQVVPAHRQRLVCRSRINGIKLTQLRGDIINRAGGSEKSCSQSAVQRVMQVNCR